jgi:hypothetical protein
LLDLGRGKIKIEGWLTAKTGSSYSCGI